MACPCATERTAEMTSADEASLADTHGARSNAFQKTSGSSSISMRRTLTFGACLRNFGDQR